MRQTFLIGGARAAAAAVCAALLCMPGFAGADVAEGGASDPAEVPAGDSVAKPPREDRVEFRDGEWGFSVVPYLWLAGARGTSTVNGQENGIDISFADILENLDFALMGRMTARWRDLSIVVEPVYLSLGQGVTVGPLRPRVGVKLLLIDMIARYGFDFAGGKERLDLVAGVRTVSLDLGLKLRNTGQKLSADDSWYKPIVGLDYSSRWSDKWKFRAHGDVGGFDPSDDFTWSFDSQLGRAIGKRSTVLFGYKLLSMKHNWSGPPNQNGIDMLFHGPVLGWDFAF